MAYFWVFVIFLFPFISGTKYISFYTLVCSARHKISCFCFVFLLLISFGAHLICFQAQKAEREATDLKGSMRKRMEFLDFD